MNDSFIVGTVPTLDVHTLRQTRLGIEFLKETGGFVEYMKRYNSTKRRPFIAWDGEGWSDDLGMHHYMLMQASTGDHIHAPQLTSAECLELLLKVAAEHKGAIHVIYGGGYDATHILRDLPDEHRLRLNNNNEVVWYCDTEDGYRNRYVIRYLPHKWLKISGYDYHSHKHVSMTIFDLMTFFQQSFIGALKSRKIAVSDEITSGKASRNTFTYEDLEEIRAYCQQELEGLVMLANTLRDELIEADLEITTWHGPGAVADATFKKFHVKKHMQTPSLEVEFAAQHAYFGGHFEQYKAGHYDGKVYLYDINSAYPHHIRYLPSLRNATWEWTTDFHGQMGVWLCSYDSLSMDHFGPNPIPWRGRGGAVGYPTTNREVWLWHPEAKLATNVIGGYQLNLEYPDVRPFAYIEEMYERRKAWQAFGRGGEKALKLSMNSAYGKLAQRVGAQDGNRPKWHQLEWAGMITSGTRAQLWEAISQAPDSIIAVETDSVASTVPLNLPIGTGLGQWGLTEYDWITYVQSGIYFASAESAASTKARTRGIDVTQLSHSDVLEWLDTGATNPLLTLSRNFIGLGNPRTYLYGQWIDGTKEVRVAGQKRLHDPRTCPECLAGKTMAESLHPLVSNALYGLTPSYRHTLPWRDTPEEMVPSEVAYIGDAIAEYDVPRRLGV